MFLLTMTKEVFMAVVRFEVGDTLVMKKKHPCGEALFTVTKCGTDVKLVCRGCGRDLILGRERLEKMIKAVNTEEK